MINRRQFLKITGAGTAVFMTGGITSLVNKEMAYAAVQAGSGFNPDLEIALKATPAEIPILPGDPTDVWHYEGQVLKGDRASLVNLERSYLGPVIRTHRGQKVRIRFTNDIADFHY
jgi:FtsP/CotA-like multicopper oxidase with cupredoxin domain